MITTVARDLFKKLEKQEQQEITAPKIENNPQLEMMVELYSSIINYRNIRSPCIYESSLEHFKKETYSKGDVESFALILPQLTNLSPQTHNYLGLFLSA